MSRHRHDEPYRVRKPYQPSMRLLQTIARTQGHLFRQLNRVFGFSRASRMMQELNDGVPV